ncbi:hypothetical protein ACXXHV_09580 [Staphylococcus epidermidis]
MINKTRFYLVRTSKGTSEYSGEQKLKYNPYNYGYAVALEDEQPTFYETEESATSIATTLNSLYKLTGVQAYVDVFKEEVKVIKVTNNSPSEVS